MADAVKWGIISTADINRKVIPGAHASPKVDLVAVASRDQERADAYAKEWDIPRAYGSYEALLADPEIEAVYISLPNNMHCEWSIKSLEAGKHVLCEKPMSRHPKRSRRPSMPRTAPAACSARRSCTATTRRRSALQQLVADGAIGELRLVRSVFSYSLYDEDNIRLRTEVEGGALMDVGCYNVSGSRLVRRRARARLRRGLVRPVGHRLGLRGTLRFPATWSRSSTAAPRSGPGRARGRSAAKARCSSTTRGTATSR